MLERAVGTEPKERRFQPKKPSSDPVVWAWGYGSLREYKRKVSAGAGKDYSRVDMGAEAIHRGDQSPSHLASAQADGELVLPDLRIPEREERRLPRQCNSQ